MLVVADITGSVLVLTAFPPKNMFFIDHAFDGSLDLVFQVSDDGNNAARWDEI